MKNSNYQIPKIIHQTWKNENIPEKLKLAQQSWKTHHSDWEYRFWTDQDNYEFISRYYRWFLPVFEAYPEAIMRADAIRYFILDYYGGVYVDLDFLCLRNLDSLLADKSLILGLEPKEHLKKSNFNGNSFKQLIGNAFIASQPKHPFWSEVIQQLLLTKNSPSVAEATGTIFLTKTYEHFKSPETITLESADRLYPIHNEQDWNEVCRNKKLYDSIKEKSYAVHLWEGSWYKDSTYYSNKNEIPVKILHDGSTLEKSIILFNEIKNKKEMPLDALPKVSCLMVTKNRCEFVKRAITCYQQQTYSAKELVIIDDSADNQLANYLDTLSDPSIIYLHLPDKNQTLGALRNIAVEHATGDYIAQWDDDDISLNNRLEIQMASIMTTQSDACFLERTQFWWPAIQSIFTSNYRIWECTMVCSKAALPCYADLRNFEDTDMVERLVLLNQVVLIDMPELYHSTIHGKNTCSEEYFVCSYQERTNLIDDKKYLCAIHQLEQQCNLKLLAA